MSDTSISEGDVGCSREIADAVWATPWLDYEEGRIGPVSGGKVFGRVYASTSGAMNAMIYPHGEEWEVQAKTVYGDTTRLGVFVSKGAAVRAADALCFGILEVRG